MCETTLTNFCAIAKILQYYSFYDNTFSAGNLSIVETFIEMVAFVENTWWLFLLIIMSPLYSMQPCLEKIKINVFT